MISIAVVDNDFANIAIVTKVISQFFEKDEYEQDDFYDGVEFVEQLRQSIKYNIVFMAIEMKIMNGDEAIRILRELEDDENTYVVFMSSYTDNLTSLFSLHPFDFIVKPLDKNIIMNILRKIKLSMSRNRMSISLTVNRRNVEIFLSEIKYIQSEAHKLNIHLCNTTEIITCYMKLNELFCLIQEKNLEFIRVHASYIVNKQYVTKYTKKFVSIGEEEIPISNKYRVNITKDSINLDVYT